jgi:hypothetical protein
MKKEYEKLWKGGEIIIQHIKVCQIFEEYLSGNLQQILFSLGKKLRNSN